MAATTALWAGCADDSAATPDDGSTTGPTASASINPDDADGTSTTSTTGPTTSGGANEDGDTTSTGDTTTNDQTTADDGSSSDSTGAPPLPPPQKDVVFNDPGAIGGGDYDDDDAVIASALALIDHACVPNCAGDVEIRMAVYRMTLASVWEALIAAAERGASVEVVLDGQEVNDTAANALTAGLGPGAVDRCGGHEDDDACIGVRIKPTGDAINHNKFLLVSATDDAATDIVWQSSSNATTSQLSKANNALIVRDDATLYASYVEYFEDLQLGAQGMLSDSNYYDSSESSIAGDTGTRLYLFPRADENVSDGPGFLVNAEDPILTLLGNLACAPGDRVWVAMAWWNDDRIEIANRLGELQQAGCAVEVLLRATDEHTNPAVLSALQAGGLTTLLHVPHLHSKYVVADGTFNGRDRQLVWTGSHNFTYGALRENDEALVRVEDPAVHAAYLANFDALLDGHGVPPP